MTHSVALRVYYEDTDAGGIVYYANYLRFIERGRSEMLRAAGIDQTALLAGQGTGFVVRRLEADYLAPARLGEDLVVTTSAVSCGRTSVTLAQDVLRGETRLFTSLVVLVAVRLGGPGPARPVRLPPAAAALFGAA